MADNQERSEFCSNHQDCMVRLSVIENQIIELKNDREVSKESYNSLKEEMHQMQINQTKNDEKIYILFEKIEDIKNSISSLASDVRLLTEKISTPPPDLFKDTVIKFGLQVIQWGLLGGLAAYIATQFAK